MKKRVYVSLPISGRPIEEAKEQAKMIKATLEGSGYEVATPFDVVDEPQGTTEKERYAYCMGRDIEELLKCDAIYMARGHENSKGCRLERMTAIIYGIEII